MRFSSFALLAGSLALAACGSDTEEAGQTDADMAAEMAETVMPLPGQYTGTVELVDFQMPDIPGVDMAQARAMAEEQFKKGVDFCLKEEDIQDGWKGYSEKMADGNCSFNRYETNGGQIDAQMACKIGDGGAATDWVATMSGTATQESQSMTMAMDQDTPVGPMKVTMKMDSQRVGECS